MQAIHSSILSSAFCLFATTVFAAPLTVFETGFEYTSVPTVGTDVNNLNGATGQIGTWTGNVPAGQGSGQGGTEFISFTSIAGDLAMLADRPVSDSTLTANFTEAIALDHARVSYEMGIRRTQNGNHNKDVAIVGFDSAGAEAFHLNISTQNNLAGEQRRIGVVTGGGATTTYDLPTLSGNDADNDMPNVGAPPFTAADVATIDLILSAAGFQISFARANRAYVTDVLAYNGAPLDLARIDFMAQGSTNNGQNSGFFLDDLQVTAVPEPSTALPLMLLALVALRRWTRK